jgi:hypothetical protein
MDPNANLTEQRRIAARIMKMIDNDQAGSPEVAEDGARLAELVQALDEWISKGGFLLLAWSK